MTLQAFALLCSLTTLASAATVAQHAQLGWIAAGAIGGIVLLLPALLGLPFAPLLAFEPAQVALLLVLFALARLRGGIGPRTELVIGGVMAVVWLQALRAVGWPLIAALPFVVAATASAAFLGLKKNFAPAQLQDDASIVVLAGGLLVALVPDIVAGWNSAQALQGAADGAGASSAAPVLWVAAGFVVLGAVFAYVRNRRWSR
ncbi:MAG: hypothetical protein ACO1PZ_05785 [Gammaproteobacteria bacterium]